MPAGRLLHLEVLAPRRWSDIHSALTKEPHLAGLASDQCVFLLQASDAKQAGDVGVLNARCLILADVIHALNVIRAGRNDDFMRSGLLPVPHTLYNTRLQ